MCLVTWTSESRTSYLQRSQHVKMSLPFANSELTVSSFQFESSPQPFTGDFTTFYPTMTSSYLGLRLSRSSPSRRSRVQVVRAVSCLECASSKTKNNESDKAPKTCDPLNISSFHWIRARTLSVTACVGALDSLLPFFFPATDRVHLRGGSSRNVRSSIL